MCEHKNIRTWERKRGWTEKCCDCKKRRYGKTLPSSYREFAKTLDGTLVVEITSLQGKTAYTDWQ